MTTRDATAPRRPVASPGLLAAAVLALAFAAVAFTLVARAGRAADNTMASDERLFHFPTVRQFTRQWPAFDFSNYPSATTPGYHLLMAAVWRSAGGGGGAEPERILRSVNALLTAGLLATLAYGAARRDALPIGRRSLSAVDTPAVCLPFAASPYVLPAGVWLVPHNPAWWCVLGVLLVALRPRVGAGTYLLGGLLLATLVFVRQVHVWAAAPLWVAAWLGSTGGADDRRRVRRTALMAAATLPAAAILAAFARLWGGLTPPGEAWASAGLSPSAPAVILSLFALYAAFFVGYLPTPRTAAASRTLIVGLLIGAAAGILPETTPDSAAGRWSGIWYVVERFPSVAGRSLLLLALSALGGGLLGLWLAALPRRQAWVVGTAVVAFAAAHVSVGQAWQRYYEPMVLMLLALTAGRVAEREAPWRGWAFVGPVVLALLLSVITARSIG